MANAESQGMTPAAARKLIQKQFKSQLGACRELEQAARDRMVPWSGRPAQRSPDGSATADDIVALEAARASKTYGACLELCEMGFAEQAAMLNRSLFEGMAVAHWVGANEEEAAERFNRALGFDAHLAAELIEHVGWADEHDADAWADARLENGELEAARREFGRYGELMWTGHRNLRALVSAIQGQWPSEEGQRQLWQFFEIVHRDNNRLLHSTASGLSRSLRGFDQDGAYFRIGPSNHHVDPALFSAHWIYLQTFTLVMDHFGLVDRAGLDEMTRGHQYDFIEFTHADVRDVGRNDPCPCGSGKKFKTCHWEQVYRT